MEYLDWLARNPLYMAHYALHMDLLACNMTVKDLAHSGRLHHTMIEGLDKLYMAGATAPTSDASHLGDWCG
jgi:hypothetical protein